MAEHSDGHSLPLTQGHVQSLVRYADGMDNDSIRDWGAAVTTDHTKEVRALALRVSQFASEVGGGFNREDVQLLSELGDGLVRSALPLLADLDVVPAQKAPAQYRLGLGNAILEVRDRVQQFVTG